MVKIVTFFLIGMIILALLGKLRLPGNLLGRNPGRNPGRGMGAPTLEARKCLDCGRHVIGKGPCGCKEKPSGRT
jgi:hypothetical protein